MAALRMLAPVMPAKVCGESPHQRRVDRLIEIGGQDRDAAKRLDAL
jgi:hypothetical protein